MLSMHAMHAGHGLTVGPPVPLALSNAGCTADAYTSRADMPAGGGSMHGPPMNTPANAVMETKGNPTDGAARTELAPAQCHACGMRARSRLGETGLAKIEEKERLH